MSESESDQPMERVTPEEAVFELVDRIQELDEKHWSLRKAVELHSEALGSTLNAERSLEQGKLVEALCDARPNFGPIKKDTKGVYGKYAPLESIVDAVGGPLAEVGIDLSFRTEFTNDRTFKVAVLTHTSGEWRSAKCLMIEEKGRGSPMQAMGATSSYARRYAVMDLLAIAPDDADTDHQAAPQRQQQRPSPLRAQFLGGEQQQRPPRLPRTGKQSNQWEENHEKKRLQWLRQQAASGNLDVIRGDILHWISKTDPTAPIIASNDLKQARHSFYITTGRKKHDGGPGWTKEAMEAHCLDVFEVPFRGIPADELEPLAIYFAAMPAPPKQGKSPSKEIHQEWRKKVTSAMSPGKNWADLKGKPELSIGIIGQPEWPATLHKLTVLQLQALHAWLTRSES